MENTNKSLKKARKTLKFWFKVLLDTDYMNDLSCRVEYQAALNTISETRKTLKRRH